LWTRFIWLRIAISSGTL